MGIAGVQLRAPERVGRTWAQRRQTAEVVNPGVYRPRTQETQVPDGTRTTAAFLPAIEAQRRLEESRRLDVDCFVIEREDGGMLPCCRTEIRFRDRESAESFLDIFRRLGHPYPGFEVCERKPK